jgi:hypothetical protein
VTDLRDRLTPAKLVESGIVVQGPAGGRGKQDPVKVVQVSGWDLAQIDRVQPVGARPGGAEVQEVDLLVWVLFAT